MSQASDLSAGTAVRTAVVYSPIVIEPLRAFVRTAQVGAVVEFLGCVRDHDHGRAVTALEYEAHPSAASVLADMAQGILADFPGVRLAAEHRVGALAIGDIALAVFVGAAHRGEAFAACARFVEDVKAQVPIWKLQHFTDGTSQWVNCL